MMVAVLVSGSAAVATLVGMSGEWRDLITIIIMLIPASVGAVSVVWRLPDRAREHEMLSRRFYEIAKKIDLESADPGKVQEWRNEILGAYEDEPAVYHALNALCYNAATKALGYGTDKLQKITFLQYHLRNVVRFRSEDFPFADGKVSV